jgi:hypothetical protein
MYVCLSVSVRAVPVCVVDCSLYIRMKRARNRRQLPHLIPQAENLPFYGNLLKLVVYAKGFKEANTRQRF